MQRKSSRIRYADYRRKLAERRRNGRRSVAPDRAHRGHKDEPRSFSRLVWEFWRLLKGYRLGVGFSLATLTVATVLKLVPPAATKVIVDNVLADKPLPQIWVDALHLPTDRLHLLFAIAAAVAIVSILSTIFHLWGRWHATKSVNLLQVSIRKRAFEHAIRLPLHRVYDLKSGGASSILREDAGKVADLIFNMFYNPWQAVVQLLGSLIVLVVVDWRLMLGGLLLLPVTYVTHRTWINRIRPLYRDIHAQRQAIDAHATEAFGGMRVVRTFGRERSETSRFISNNQLMTRQQIFVWWWSRIIEIVWNVIIPLASTGLLLYGGYAIIQGRLTLGDLTMFLFYLTMLLGPLAALASSAAAFQTNLAGLDRVLDLLEEPRDMPSSPRSTTVQADEIEGQITFCCVSFHYPETSQLALEHIDLEVEAGETIALVGPSGAGKTTLCNLVARFYDPAAGHIELDGQDLRDIDVESYRRLLGIVEQDVFLFDGTIRENIRYAVRRASQKDVEDAARAANAHEFIMALNRGYETVVGERGVRLSGGQRQRLAIARALLADPRILILDEATSNLDSESERLIQDSLAELRLGRTSFVVAHRLSTIVGASRIVVLESGRILASGPHDELMAASPRYRQMVEAQTFTAEAY